MFLGILQLAFISYRINLMNFLSLEFLQITSVHFFVALAFMHIYNLHVYLSTGGWYCEMHSGLSLQWSKVLVGLPQLSEAIIDNFV